MRLALICQNFNARGGVSRDAFMFATALAERGVDVACYCDPRTSTSAAGVALHNVASLETKRPARIGAALAHASFAYHATRAIVRDRTRYDVVFVVGTNGFVQDVVRVHAVVKGETRRWPERGGHEFPRARIRARLAPVARPQNGVERLIQARQFAQSHSRRLVAVTDEVKEDV